MYFRRILSIFDQKRKRSPLAMQVNHLRKFISYAEDGGVPPVESLDLGKLRITWVIPDFRPGAGGHMTIFRIARYLEEFGHTVSFLIQNPSEHKTSEEARATINAHFQPFNGTVELFSGKTPSTTGDALIATDRFTCYPVKAMGGFIRKFYFVQDFEPYFYPVGSESLLTEATYHFDFDCLCAGDWLHSLMSEKYMRWSMAWPLAYDASVYNLDSASQPRTNNRIALYARYVTPRRAVELAFMALDILQERGVDFEVDFFGWDIGDIEVGYSYRDHGVLGSHELAELYRQSTVGVVFSATNHSLVNKEMMACGLPVIDLDRETVRAIFPEGTMRFANPTPEGIADALEDLLGNAQAREDIAKSGLSLVNNLSWEKSARLVEEALRDRVAQHANQETN